MNRFKNILYVSETSVAQEGAMARAVSLAQNNQAALTVVDVTSEVSSTDWMPSNGPGAVELQEAVKSERRRALEQMVAPYRSNLEIRIDVLVGKNFLEVIRTVLRDRHDLVIKCAENPDWVDRIFGSDDMHLLRKCPCPLWMMKPVEKSNYDSIVAAVDFDPADPGVSDRDLNRLILELASSLAVSDFASLHLVHVWDAPDADLVRLWADNPEAAEIKLAESERLRHETGMERLTETLRHHVGADAYEYLSPRVYLRRGSAIRVIPDLVKQLNADLVVMGTVARSGISGVFIGNTAEGILDQLECSVLAVKPPGFISPVKQVQ